MTLDSELGYPGQAFGRVSCLGQSVYGGGSEGSYRLSFSRRGGCDVKEPDLVGYLYVSRGILTNKESKIAYSGSNEGCTLTPPYFAAVSNLEGTNRPKDTATIRSIGPSGG